MAFTVGGFSGVVSSSDARLTSIFLLNSSSKSSRVIFTASSLVSVILCILNATYSVSALVVSDSPLRNNVEFTST